MSDTPIHARLWSLEQGCRVTRPTGSRASEDNFKTYTSSTLAVVPWPNLHTRTGTPLVRVRVRDPKLSRKPEDLQYLPACLSNRIQDTLAKYVDRPSPCPCHNPEPEPNTVTPRHRHWRTKLLAAAAVATAVSGLITPVGGRRASRPQPQGFIFPEIKKRKGIMEKNSRRSGPWIPVGEERGRCQWEAGHSWARPFIRVGRAEKESTRVRACVRFGRGHGVRGLRVGLAHQCHSAFIILPFTEHL